MKKILLVALLISYFGCTSRMDLLTTSEHSDESFYTVYKTKREKNEVYLIYAVRNDTIFKLFSHYDGVKSKGDVRIRKGDRFISKLQPALYEYLPGVQVYITFYGVDLSWDDEGYKKYVQVNNIYSCEDLNGLYINRNRLCLK